MYSKKYLLNDRGKSNRSSKFQIFYLTWRGRNSSFSINSNLVTMKNGFAADKFSMSCSGQAFTRTSCPTICESVSIIVGLNSPPLPSHSPSHNSPVLYNHPTQRFAEKTVTKLLWVYRLYIICDMCIHTIGEHTTVSGPSDFFAPLTHLTTRTARSRSLK